MTIPQWAIDYISEWKTRLYLHDWEIQTDCNSHPAGSEGNQACVSVYPDILVATMTLRSDIPETEETGDLTAWKKTIIHELLHVRLARITEMVQSNLIPELPVSAQAMIDRAFRSEVEPVIETMAQVLYSCLQERLDDV